MRIYWPWWLLPLLLPVWLAVQFVKLVAWLVSAPFNRRPQRRDVVSIKIRVSDDAEKPPA